MSIPISDASTHALFAELQRRGEDQARLAQSRADHRLAKRQAKNAALHKERGLRTLRAEQEADRTWHDQQDALEHEAGRKARVDALLDDKRQGRTASILSLAGHLSGWMPTDESEFDGSSRWDDFDNTIPFDMKAIDCIEGDPFKLTLAQSLNKSNVESEGNAETWRVIKRSAFALGKNRYYDRYVTTNPWQIGDNHQFALGERGVVAAVVVGKSNKKVTFDLADHPTPAATTITEFYAVEWVKRTLDLTKASAQALWLQVNFGRTLPKREKWVQHPKTKKWTKIWVPKDEAFIYEPARYIRVGACDLEIGPGVAAETVPTFDEDGNVVNQDEIDSSRNARRNLPSVAVKSLAEEAEDVAYFWAQEMRTLDSDVTSGDTEGYTIPGARQYGSDKAIHMESLANHARKHRWTVTDLDMWVKRRQLKGGRGINPNAPSIKDLRASLPEETIDS